jgi:hypothetical protein
VWYFGGGGVGFIKRMELRGEQDHAMIGLDWIELGLACRCSCFNLFCTVPMGFVSGLIELSLASICNYLGRFVACMWVEPGV